MKITLAAMTLASSMIVDTAEQLGGALGIAILEAIELGINFSKLHDHFDEHGIHPTRTRTKWAAT